MCIWQAAFPPITPNGIDLFPDEKRLNLAEPGINRVWCFDIGEPVARISSAEDLEASPMN